MLLTFGCTLARGLALAARMFSPAAALGTALAVRSGIRRSGEESGRIGEAERRVAGGGGASAVLALQPPRWVLQTAGTALLRAGD